MKLHWWRKNDTKREEEHPTDYAILMCNAARACKLKEYLEWLEQRPKNDIIEIFLSIINSKYSFLPIVAAEEKPPVIIDGISFDPIQNVEARMRTKIYLLLLVGDESKKLGIWKELERQWTEKYIAQNKELVQDMEGIARHCENNGQEADAANLRKGIERIKEINKEYSIDW